MRTHNELFIFFGLIIALSGCRAFTIDETATEVVEGTISPSQGGASGLITPGNQTATSSNIPLLLIQIQPQALHPPHYQLFQPL